MLATTHALVGAAIVKQIPNTTLSLPLVFLSHFILDIIPHWDVLTNGKKRKLTILWQASLDVIISFIAIWFFFGRNNNNAAIFYLAAFISQLPDWIEAPYILLKYDFPPFSAAYKLQHILHYKLRLPWGILPQIPFLLLPFFS